MDVGWARRADGPLWWAKSRRAFAHHQRNGRRFCPPYGGGTRPIIAASSGRGATRSSGAPAAANGSATCDERQKCDSTSARSRTPASLAQSTNAVGAAAGEMQHAVELPGGERRPHRRRKGRGLDGAIDRHGAHRHVVCRERGGEVDGAVLAREMEQGSAGAAPAQQAHEVAGIAVGRGHRAEARRARGLGAAAADREQRQLHELGTARMRRDRARRVGAGDDDAGPIVSKSTMAEVGIGDGFDAQQRSEQDVVAARAQRCGGALAVGLGPGHQQAHASHSVPSHFVSLHRGEEIGAGAGFELAAGVGAERRGVGDGARARGLEGFAAVGLGDQAAERQAAVRDGGVAGDRRAAGAVEHGQERALGGKR